MVQEIKSTGSIVNFFNYKYMAQCEEKKHSSVLCIFNIARAHGLRRALEIKPLFK